VEFKRWRDAYAAGQKAEEEARKAWGKLLADEQKQKQLAADAEARRPVPAPSWQLPM
jgi:hypothetical protein